MATLGDPLADLGYTLIYWTDPGDVIEPDRHRHASRRSPPCPASSAAPISSPSMRAAAAAASTAVDFYQVLALYKLAIISEGIYARYLQGKTLGEGFAGMTARGRRPGAARAGDRGRVEPIRGCGS